jgi:hypothetical protein
MKQFPTFAAILPKKKVPHLIVQTMNTASNVCYYVHIILFYIWYKWERIIMFIILFYIWYKWEKIEE